MPMPPAGYENQEEWVKWRTCTRKVKFHEKPRATDRMEVYHCPYCDGWHKTKRKSRNKIERADKPAQRIVLRGGFWIPK